MDKSLLDLSGRDWIFDLDNTLYPPTSSLFPQVEKRMTEFICERLGLEHDKAKEKQKLYFKEYGTTLRGLMDFDSIDAHEFLDFVHDIDYSHLGEDEALGDMLGKLQGRKIIFTNGSVSHAKSVLDRLGIRSHFDFIFDIVGAGFVPKPHFSGYDILFKEASIDADRCVMVEDIAKNLSYPYDCGVATVWIENDLDFCQSDGGDYIDYSVSDLVEFLGRVVRAGG